MKPKPTGGRKPTEIVRVPAHMAGQIRAIAYAERRRVADVLAELLAGTLPERYAKLPKSARTR